MRSAEAPRDRQLAKPVQAGVEGRRTFALHDRDRARRGRRGEAHRRSCGGRRGRQADRGGVGRLAEDPVEPEVVAGDRLGDDGNQGLTIDGRKRGSKMIDLNQFKPRTVYVTYIAASPERVWQALTDPAFSRQYFFGFAVEVEPAAGGSFRLLYPDGRTHIRGEVVEWSPPRRFACTWLVEGVKELAELPTCLVAYDIEASGEVVRLTMTESHSWDVPEAILAGGQAGWPAILSNLKSVLETGTPMTIEMAPPTGFMEAVQKAVAEKPWLRG